MTADTVALRITPIIVILALGYATYAIAAYLCGKTKRKYAESLLTNMRIVEFLYRDLRKSGTATALLTLFFLFFLLAWIPYARTFYNAVWKPGVVSFTKSGVLGEDGSNRSKEAGQDIEAQTWGGPDMNIDSPGLETFYSKDIFTCEADGRPRWCTECRQWKPDRARHSRQARRCIHKMDHLCPWVGGIVSETCEFPGVVKQLPDANKSQPLIFSSSLISGVRRFYLYALLQPLTVCGFRISLVDRRTGEPSPSWSCQHSFSFSPSLCLLGPCVWPS